jgi:hypothetical protein
MSKYVNILSSVILRPFPRLQSRSNRKEMKHITVTRIESLENELCNLESETQILLDLPNQSYAEILPIVRKNSINYRRTGFKTWEIIPKKTITEPSNKIIIVWTRLIALLMAIALFFVLVNWSLAKWDALEKNFANRNLAGGIITSAFLTILGALIRKIKGVSLSTYLGVSSVKNLWKTKNKLGQ